jgi:hypothetical protein
MFVLVCGDRNWKDAETIRRVLEVFPHDTVIVEGGARGADKIAGAIALDLHFTVIEVRAEWDRYGKGAGPKRNEQMLKIIQAEKDKMVIAFHPDLKRSKGTANMVQKAVDAGIKVLVVHNRVGE